MSKPEAKHRDRGVSREQLRPHAARFSLIVLAVPLASLFNEILEMNLCVTH